MKKALILLSCLWLLGCVTASVSLFDPQKAYEPVAVDQVAIYLLERHIPADAERLGTIAIQFPTTYSDIEIQRDVKNACAKIGATGAIRVNEGTRPTHEGWFQITYLAFRIREISIR